jgi:DNA topoisomerase-1
VTKQESDDDVPLARTKPTKRPKLESESDTPLAKPKKSKTVASSKPNGTNGVKSETSSPQKAPSKKRVKDEDVKDEDEDDEYRWWEAAQGDGTKKWTTLEHNGVLFPPPYEPLPKHVKMKYDGKEVTLPPEAEEVAGFFAALLESDHAKNPTFQQNFFNDWVKILKNLKVVCPLFHKVDFRHLKSNVLRNAISDRCGNTLKRKRKRKKDSQRTKKQKSKRNVMNSRQNIKHVS